MSNSNESCKSCRFFDHDHALLEGEDGAGACVRRCPQVNDKGHTVRAQTWSSRWCGEYEPARVPVGNGSVPRDKLIGAICQTEAVILDAQIKLCNPQYTARFVIEVLDVAKRELVQIIADEGIPPIKRNG